VAFLEQRLDNAIAIACGLSPVVTTEIQSDINLADAKALAIEKAKFFSKAPQPWDWLPDVTHEPARHLITMSFEVEAAVTFLRALQLLIKASGVTPLEKFMDGVNEYLKEMGSLTDKDGRSDQIIRD
jgi:hypothetical protein